MSQEFCRINLPYRDGEQQHVLTVTTRADQPGGKEALGTLPVVDVDNGLFCSTEAYAELIATLARRGVAVVTHNDPEGCHRLDDKAGRSDAVTRVAGQYHPVTKISYSQSALSATVNGPGLVADGLVSAFAFVAPAGIVRDPGIPEGFEAVGLGVQRHALAMLAYEYRQMMRQVLAARAGFGAAYAFHVRGFHGALQYGALVAEAHATFTGSIMPGVVDLGRMVTLGVFGGDRDSYFPGHPMQQTLVNAGFPDQDMTVYNGAHTSPLFVPQLMGQIADFVVAVSPERQQLDPQH
ncbi:MAG TPA: hypothetical protein VLH84_05665 [Patescibacteria group bacterium]|nr:hypothetical protein [Patescibacteria group bacterium]